MNDDSKQTWTNTYALSVIRNQGLSVQANKADTSDHAATGTGQQQLCGTSYAYISSWSQ
jgi:hypothetical protein